MIAPARINTLTTKKDTESYTTFGNITIDGNTQFATKAATYNWDLGGQRDGSSTSPYMIANYDFSSSELTLVSIANTNLYFESTNNYLDGNASSSIGLQLLNVVNAKIDNNTMMNFKDNAIYASGCSLVTIGNNSISSTLSAMVLRKSSDLKITDNHIDSSLYDGLYVYSLTDSIINANTITHSSQYAIEFNTNNTIMNNLITSQLAGIYLEMYANDNRITNNSIQMSSTNAILLLQSNNNLINNNTFNDNPGTGILVDTSAGTEIVSNSFSNTQNDAIYLYLATNTNISYNTINNTRGRGIGMKSSNSTMITHNILSKGKNYAIYLYADTTTTNITRNEFFYNSIEYTHQVRDIGTNNHFTYNYWSDWTGTDRNNDSIIDRPYIISISPINQSDPYPIISPEHMDAVYNPYFPPVNTTTTNPGGPAKQVSTSTSPSLPLTAKFMLLPLILIPLIYRKKQKFEI